MGFIDKLKEKTSNNLIKKIIIVNSNRFACFKCKENKKWNLLTFGSNNLAEEIECDDCGTIYKRA